MEFTQADIDLLEKCKNNPDRYVIHVNSDHIGVEDKEADESYSFAEYGEQFISQLLRYNGANVYFY